MNRTGKNIIYAVGIAMMLAITGGFAFELVGHLVKLAFSIESSSALFQLLGATGLLLAFFVSGALTIWAIIIAAKSKRQWASMNAHMIESGPRAQSKVLIVGLSLPSVYQQKMPVKEAWSAITSKGLKEVGSNKKDTDIWDTKGITAHNWIMPLCAINRHLGRLEVIYILPSKQSFSDAKDIFLPGLKQMLKQSGHENLMVKLACEKNCAPDYLEYNAVQDAMIEVLDVIKRQHNVYGRDICIDATPGQKPFSIAAASVTYSTEALFGYVDTTTRKVHCYDARIDLGFFTEF